MSADAPTNGQTLQFAVSTTNSAAGLTWADANAGTSHTFSGLTIGATYYIFTRSASNANYDAGAASASISVTTKKVPTIADLTYTIPTGDVYDGTTQGIGSVTGTGMGTITVKYDGLTTVPTNAGTYSITVDVSGGDDYVATNGISLGNYTIGKKNVVIIGATISSKIYDGTATLPVANVTAIAFDDAGVGANYILTAAAFTGGDYNVGNGKPTAITVELTGAAATNYNLTNPTYTGATADITKATAAGVDQLIYIKELTAGNYTFDLATLLPGITSPMELGGVTYTPTIGTNVDFLDSLTYTSGNTLTITRISHSDRHGDL